jgi:nucleotide-binding universal stress UspA family protein
MKILLAVDGSPCSDDAISEVARRPWPPGSEIEVLAAFEVPLPPSPDAWALPPSYLEDLDRIASEHARSLVDRVGTRLRSAFGEQLQVATKYLPGGPASVILDEAESWGADLIVVGSHGYRAWERFLLGSISQSVVSHAKCSVEVVRCRERRVPAEVAG